MALRAEKQVPPVYFGKPGKLHQLPWPAGGIEKPFERQTYDFLTGSGFHQVSQLQGGSRLIGAKWDALHIDNYNLLHQYFVGANGPGPYVFLDPSEANLLPPNVSSSLSLYRSGYGLISAGDATGGNPVVNTDPAFIHRLHGDTSIKWTFTGVPVATPRLGVSGLYRAWHATPVLAGQPYTFSSWMRADGVVDSSIQASIRLEFVDSADVTVGSSFSSGDLTFTAAWQRASVTATAPVGAVYVYARWYGVGATIATGGSLYIDEPLLEYGSAVNDWAPSTGIRPVQILGLTDNAPFSGYMREDIQLQLRELTR